MLRILIRIVILIMISAVPALAQDATPEAPPAATPDIPVLPVASPTSADSAAPALPDLGQPLPTPSGGEPGEPVQPEAPAALPAAVCPIQVSESFVATDLICDPVNPGDACLGSGVVEIEPRSQALTLDFAAPGDRVRLENISEMRLRTLDTESALWSVVSARPAMQTESGAGSPPGGAIIFFGDLSFSDTTPRAGGGSFSTANVIAQNGLNVRRAPDESGVVVWQLGAGEAVVVTGITPDRNWLRIEIPSAFGGAGWVYAPYMDVLGGTDSLPFVTADSPPPEITTQIENALVSFDLLSAPSDPSCVSTPDGGILIQSPSGTADRIQLQINGVELRLSGSIFVTAQAEAALTVAVLEGEVEVSAGGSSVLGRAGSQVVVNMNASLEPAGAPSLSPYDPATLDALPISLLPRPFQLLPPTGEGVTPPAASAEESPTVDAAVCTVTAADTVKNLRAGPGTSYAVTNTLEAGASTSATGQARDGFGFTWYLTDLGWIRFDTVERSGDCEALPEVEPPPVEENPAPTPTLEPGSSLSSDQVGELCGQQVAALSTISDGSDLFVSLGGTWTASENTTVGIATSGGQFRPELGDYIQIVDEIGNVLARSGDARTLDYTFSIATSFNVIFSAANGDTVEAEIRCVLAE